MKKIIWFTGLPGSGKTTLARELKTHIINHNKSCILLDGDELRAGFCSDLDFSNSSRVENIRRIAELAYLLIKQTDYIVVATISPYELLRKNAKKIIGEDLFLLVYLSTSLETCSKRDPKGLYKKADQGLITNLTGVGSSFEIPNYFDLKIDTEKYSIQDSLRELINLIKI